MESVILRNLLPICIMLLTLFSSKVGRALFRAQKQDVQLLANVSFLTFSQAWLFIPPSLLVSAMLLVYSKGISVRLIYLIYTVIAVTIWLAGVLFVVIPGPKNFWKRPRFIRGILKFLVFAAALLKIIIEYHT